MSTMTESRNVTWRPIEQVIFARKPYQCSFPGCTGKPTQVRITHLPRTRKFAYCDGHLHL